MAKKIRVWDGSAWQDVAPALPYTAVHSAQASMPSTAVDGQIWLDTDASVPSTTVTRWYKLPSAGTTTLSGNDDNSIPLAYTPGYEQVFLNGTLLSRSAADYTATTGTSVVLSSAIVAGDIVEIICPLQITTTDTYTQAATNAAFQANTNNFAAGKNKIINGDFGVWQRGTTFSSIANGSYSADRWVLAANKTTTITQQAFTAGSAPTAGYEGQYFLRAAWSADGSYAAIATRLEDCRLFAGQTVTLSYWAKSNVNVTNNAGWSQYFGSGGSSQISGYADNTTITTSWQRFTYTFTVPSVSGKTIGSSNYFIVQPILIQTSSAATIDVWGVQLEAGSNATAFQTATGTIQGELAACQRYYFRNYANAGYQRFGSGLAQSTTLVYTTMNLPVEMRVIPTAFEYPTVSSNFCVWDGVTITNATALSMAANSKNIVEISATVASGLTQYRPYYTLAQGASTSAYIGVSAEL